MERIAEALDEMYGARVEPIVRKKGELHCIGLYADFPDDRYIPDNGSVLEKTIGVVGGILLSPDMQGGLLRGDYVESERKNLIDDIRASINDKRGYSIDRLLEEMCPDEAFGVSKLGSENEARAITPEALTAHYRNIIANSKVEVFYCGTEEHGRIEALICSALQRLPERAGASKPKTEIVLYPPEGSPRRFTEELDVSQGKLTVGFRLGKAMKEPDYPALMVLNSLYGGAVPQCPGKTIALLLCQFDDRQTQRRHDRRFRRRVFKVRHCT
jgi:predicted Zn-dependent peptidase